MNPSVTVEIDAVRVLSEEDRMAMERLYRAYYEGALEADFVRDLDAKDAVIVLREGGSICGFSTFKVLSVAGMTILFSGDTVVDAHCRGQPGLAGAFGHVMARLNREYDPGSLHWFLICKGARTYRFLPTFFRRYVPGSTHDAVLEERLRNVAAAMFPVEYAPEDGVLHFGHSKDRLRSDALRNDSESVRFRTLNPGWVMGDELCCLVPLRMDNLNARGRRVIEATRPAWNW